MLMVHFLATAFMTGIIWFVQLVHYPLFKYLAPEKFQSSMKYHQLFTTVIVGPAMLLELTTAIALLFSHSSPILVWINLGGVIALWGLTYFVSVPKHEKLVTGFDETTINLLIKSNWLRTFIWTLRCLIVFYLVSRGSRC
jgi:hypothetical protein